MCIFIYIHYVYIHMNIYSFNYRFSYIYILIYVYIFKDIIHTYIFWNMCINIHRSYIYVYHIYIYAYYVYIYVYRIYIYVYRIYIYVYVYISVSGHLVHRECAILPPTFIFTNAFTHRILTKISIILPKIDQHYSQSYSHSFWGISSLVNSLAGGGWTRSPTFIFQLLNLIHTCGRKTLFLFVFPRRVAEPLFQHLCSNQNRSFLCVPSEKVLLCRNFLLAVFPVSFDALFGRVSSGRHFNYLVWNNHHPLNTSHFLQRILLEEFVPHILQGFQFEWVSLSLGGLQQPQGQILLFFGFDSYEEKICSREIFDEGQYNRSGKIFVRPGAFFTSSSLFGTVMVMPFAQIPLSASFIALSDVSSCFTCFSKKLPTTVPKGLMDIKVLMKSKRSCFPRISSFFSSRPTTTWESRKRTVAVLKSSEVLIWNR